MFPVKVYPAADAAGTSGAPGADGLQRPQSILCASTGPDARDGSMTAAVAEPGGGSTADRDEPSSHLGGTRADSTGQERPGPQRVGAAHSGAAVTGRTALQLPPPRWSDDGTESSSVTAGGEDVRTSGGRSDEPRSKRARWDAFADGVPSDGRLRIGVAVAPPTSSDDNSERLETLIESEVRLALTGCAAAARRPGTARSDDVAREERGEKAGPSSRQVVGLSSGRVGGQGRGDDKVFRARLTGHSRQAPIGRRKVWPTNAGAGPSWAEAGPSQAEAGPSQAEAGPSRLEAGPSRAEVGSSRAEAGPSRLEVGPNRLEAGPSRLGAGLSLHAAAAADSALDESMRRLDQKVLDIHLRMNDGLARRATPPHDATAATGHDGRRQRHAHMTALLRERRRALTVTATATATVTATATATATTATPPGESSQHHHTHTRIPSTSTGRMIQ